MATRRHNLHYRWGR